MSANEDTLGGQTKGENNEDLARSLGEENTQNADTNANSREDQSTSGDIDNDLALTDDDAELIDLSTDTRLSARSAKGVWERYFWLPTRG